MIFQLILAAGQGSMEIIRDAIIHCVFLHKTDLLARFLSDSALPQEIIDTAFACAIKDDEYIEQMKVILDKCAAFSKETLVQIFVLSEENESNQNVVALVKDALKIKLTPEGLEIKRAFGM